MRKKKYRFPKGASAWSQNQKTTILGCRTEFFFLSKKKLIVVFFGVKFSGDYRDVAIISSLFRHHGQNSKHRIFHSFYHFWPWSRNNYVMIPTTLQLPVNYTPKNYTSKLNFEKTKISIPERGLRFGLKIGKRPFWDVGRNFFFLWKKTLIIVFFGVKFTGDYRNVANIWTLFRDHSQNSEKPNFSSFFLLFTVITK